MGSFAPSTARLLWSGSSQTAAGLTTAGAPLRPIAVAENGVSDRRNCCRPPLPMHSGKLEQQWPRPAGR
jgi:hypothetical protein